MKYWSRDESKERFPRAITPLGWSLLRVPLEATLSQMSASLGLKNVDPNQIVLWHDFYIYNRKKYFSRIPFLSFKISFIFKFLKVFIQVCFKSFFKEGNFKINLSGLLVHELYGENITHIIKGWDKERNSLKQIMGKQFNIDPTRPIEIREFKKIKSTMQEDSRAFFAHDFDVYFFKKLIFDMLTLHLSWSGQKKDNINILLTDLIKGTKENHAIDMINDFADASITKDELLKRYGHITDNWDIYAPTFGELDHFFCNRNFSKNFTTNNNKENSREEILNTIGVHQFSSQFLDWLTALTMIDEGLRAFSSLQYPEVRKLMTSVAQALAYKKLEMPDDGVYFLSLGQIEQALSENNFLQFKDQIIKNRIDYNLALNKIPPFEVIEYENGVFSSVKEIATSKKDITGECVSSGCVSGKVVYVGHVEKIINVTKNDILVLESATPVYSAYYVKCGGIISEMGGILSHGAIVAREFSIPMLTGVKNACVILKDGDEITLDATNGIVIRKGI
jgi:phosphohistidine swiveling domain-containing protein